MVRAPWPNKWPKRGKDGEMTASKIRRGTYIGKRRVIVARCANSRTGRVIVVTLDDGTESRFPYLATVADAWERQNIPAGPVADGGYMGHAPAKIRAWHGVWRGESDGRRGERVTATMAQWDK